MKKVIHLDRVAEAYRLAERMDSAAFNRAVAKNDLCTYLIDLGSKTYGLTLSPESARMVARMVWRGGIEGVMTRKRKEWAKKKAAKD